LAAAGFAGRSHLYRDGIVRVPAGADRDSFAVEWHVVVDFGEYNYRKRYAMTNLEQIIIREISTLPESRLTDVLKYVRFIKLGLADRDEIEKRFDKSWKRVRVRAKKLNITQEDIDAEIRAVRAGS
jgi:D-serine deaminase-like pyridoxal phosphate-dependent protein